MESDLVAIIGIGSLVVFATLQLLRFYNVGPSIYSSYLAFYLFLFLSWLLFGRNRGVS